MRTDRAHVMLAAALMGKRVEASPIAYDKVEALAETLPSGVGERVRMVASPRTPPPPAARPVSAALEALHAHGTQQLPVRVARDRMPRVTAFILSRDRPEQLAACVRSVLAAGAGARVLILDNNSGPHARAAVSELSAAQPEVELADDGP